MARQTLRAKITGVSPLLMHNGQLVDPMNKFTKAMKEIRDRKDKTDAGLAELARLEWHGSLYLKDGRPCIPGAMMEACLVEAAKKVKKGKQARAGIICPEDSPLDYEGPKSIEELFESGFKLTVQCVIKRDRIMRTRPMFKKWGALVDIWYDDIMFNRSDIINMLKTAGDYIGIGDWRPKFGMFTVEV